MRPARTTKTRRSIRIYLPPNYKQEILDTLTRTLVDPTNIRDAYISDPVLRPVGKDQRYTACVRYNARDANRQYEGSTDRIAYFFGGHLNQLVEASKEQCGKAAYKPFPELEKLCLGKCAVGSFSAARSGRKYRRARRGRALWAPKVKIDMPAPYVAALGATPNNSCDEAVNRVCR